LTSHTRFTSFRSLPRVLSGGAAALWVGSLPNLIFFANAPGAGFCPRGLFMATAAAQQRGVVFERRGHGRMSRS
jgi:nitroreductase